MYVYLYTYAAYPSILYTHDIRMQQMQIKFRSRLFSYLKLYLRGIRVLCVARGMWAQLLPAVVTNFSLS